MNSKISLAVIGTSDGNGHPYSWSAIINGYNKNELENCPFPIIREYMSEIEPSKTNFKDVEVTHIWTQNKDESERISKFAKIKTIVEDRESVIPHVDGILLARDDYQKHLELSRPFLKSGLPIFIDKPIAISKNNLKKILGEQEYEGQIFSCSAIKYANEFNLADNYFDQFGQLTRINAFAPKDWHHYSIHIIDPILKLLGPKSDYTLIKKSITKEGLHSAVFDWQNNLIVEFTTTGHNTPLYIEIIGEMMTKKIFLKDTYSAFKNTLELFIDNIRNNVNPIYQEELFMAVDIIEKGSIE
jgi:predicted dehydrogenase